MAERTTPKRNRVNSKWYGTARRVDASLRVDDARWIRTHAGWRYVTDSVSEQEWIARRHPSIGFVHGAAVGGTRAVCEPVPLNRPDRGARHRPCVFDGPMDARTHDGETYFKPRRELRSFAHAATVRGKPATDLGIRLALKNGTYARVCWPDDREDWVNLYNVDRVGGAS